MVSRRGSLLEKNVESIFSAAGFDTETNVFIADYEIDVHAEVGDIEVIAECKQYEESNLQVRNLIHEWKGKNKSIEADIVILVIYGQDISQEEQDLARDNKILIWDEEEIRKLLTKDDKKVKNYIFENLPLREDIGDSFKTSIRKLVWKPYLEGDHVNDNLSHEELLLMVKERIRRELFQKGTTQRERKNHIQVFENVTKKGLIRSKIQVKNAEKKFNKIAKKLDSNETPLKESQEEKYLNYLHSVKQEYEDAKRYYLDNEGLQKVERLVTARLKFLMKHGGEVEFSPRSKIKPINASRSNAKISLDFQIRKASDLETIRWILMKKGRYRRVEKGDSIQNMVSFTYDDIDEATNAVIRVMKEYHGFDLDEIRLIDKKKDQLTKGESLFTRLLR